MCQPDTCGAFPAMTDELERAALDRLTQLCRDERVRKLRLFRGAEPEEPLNTHSVEKNPLHSGMDRRGKEAQVTRIHSAMITLAVLTVLCGAALSPSRAATFIVNSPADTDDGICDGVNCTLREAINSANANPGGDVIVFTLGSGTPSIQPATPLPQITDKVVIDGGIGGATRVELNGALIETEATGLHLTSAENTLRSLVVNGFNGYGIELSGGGGNRVENCFVGCSASGMEASPNRLAGIALTGSSGNLLVSNVLSGNTNSGVIIYQGAGNVIRGNYIGVAVDGSTKLPNQDGVILIDTANNAIGGTGSADANIIGGNTSDGIEMHGLQCSGNKVQGNTIGTNSSWANLGNGDDGVELNMAARCNSIGGANAFEGNVIAFSGASGVEIASTCVDNVIQGNSITSCGLLGIDLAPIGEVNPNDDQDTDTGANEMQNYPVLSSAVAWLGGMTITGSLSGQPLQSYYLEFFTNDVCGPEGVGFGRTYLGSFRLSVDENGAGPFQADFATRTPGSLVTATATDAKGNTSEFSACCPVERIIRVQQKATRDPVMVGGSVGRKFSLWGSVIPIDENSFRLSDGSGVTVLVDAPGHGMQPGAFARAEGTLDVSAGESLLASSAGHIVTQSDLLPPQITVSSPSVERTRFGPVDFLITYEGAQMITLGDGDVVLHKTMTADGVAQVLPHGPNTRLVRISDTTGDGAISIEILPGTAVDNSGNVALGTTPSAGVVVDNTPPSVTITGPSVQTTSGGPVDYVVNYAGAARITLGLSDVTVHATGDATGSVSVFGSGLLARTIRLSGTEGNGTLAISVAAGTAADSLGNSALAAGPSDPVQIVTPPTEITIGDPSVFHTNTGPVVYPVHYTYATVITLSEADVTLNKTGTADGTVTVSGSGIYDREVTISNVTGDGTLGISLAAGTASGSGGTASEAGPSTPFNVDNVAPGISVSAPSAALTNTGPVTFDVTYASADAVTLANEDVTLLKTGTADAALEVSGSGTESRTVTLSSITGDGTLAIAIGAATASDLAGNLAPQTDASAAFEVDNTAPAVEIGQPSVAITNSGPVTFAVTFTGFSATTLTEADITLHKTGTADATLALSGSSSDYTVTLSNTSGDGTLSFSIAAGTAVDAAGNLAAAAGPGAEVTIDNIAPAISVSGPSKTLTNTGPVTFTVTYTGADIITLNPSDITLNKTGTADATVEVSGDGSTTRTVTLHAITGDGTLGIRVNADSASDFAGNLAPASNATSTFAVDNTPPVAIISNPSKYLTTAGPIVYTVTYQNYSSISLTPADIILNKTGTADGTVTLSGSTAVRTVTISNVTGDGTLGISVAPGTAVDTAGNLAPAAGPSNTFTVDNTPPTITLTGPSVPSTISGPVDFRVTYGGFSNISLSAANVTINKTGTATGSVSILWLSVSERMIRVHTISGNGTIGVSIAPGTAIDWVYLTAPGAGPSATAVVGSGNP